MTRFIKALTLAAILFAATHIHAALICNETSERYQLLNYTIPTTGTLSFWVYPTWAQTDSTDHLFMDSRVDSSNAIQVRKDTGNALRAGWITAGTDHRAAVASGSYTLNQNTWNNITVTWDDTANETHLWLNGTLVASQTATLVTHAESAAFFCTTSAGGTNCNCALSEIAVWTRVLTSGEIAAKFSPLFFLNGLQPYFPAIRNDSLSPSSDFIFYSRHKYSAGSAVQLEGVDGFTNTLQAHPPIFYPRGMK